MRSRNISTVRAGKACAETGITRQTLAIVKIMLCQKHWKRFLQVESSYGVQIGKKYLRIFWLSINRNEKYLPCIKRQIIQSSMLLHRRFLIQQLISQSHYNHSLWVFLQICPSGFHLEWIFNPIPSFNRRD